MAQANSLPFFCSLILAFVNLSKFGKVDSSNILFFHSFGTSSHRTAIWPLAEALANRGHNITYIFPLTRNRLGSHPKIVEIIPSKMVSYLEDNVLDFDINIRIEKRHIEWIVQVSRICYKLCEAFYSSPEILEWLAIPDLHFDLVILDISLGECAYGLVHKFQAKLIQFTPLLFPFMFDAFGVDPEASSLPDFLIHPRPTEMTFMNRVVSTLMPLLFRVSLTNYLDNLRPVISNGLNITDLPRLEEFEGNTSLVLVNNYLVEDYPRALPPMFVSYSGLWCSKEKIKERKPLPQNISNFVERSKGFFYISFGSAVVSSTMPAGMRNQFFNAFKRMPEYSFLWRWHGPVPEDTPKNALLLPWFPQLDILAHPKIKGFMMQGGLPSTQEALCHAVPLIVTPIFGDQDYNAMRLEQVGAALILDIDEISDNTIVQNFKQLLENRTHTERFKALSEQFMDRPLDPLENVIFWTEYVLRRDTSLLRPLSIKQSWWQRRLLDVYTFLFVALLIIFAVVVFTLKRFTTRVIINMIGNAKIKAN